MFHELGNGVQINDRDTFTEGLSKQDSPIRVIRVELDPTDIMVFRGSTHIYFPINFGFTGQVHRDMHIRFDGGGKIPPIYIRVKSTIIRRYFNLETRDDVHVLQHRLNKYYSRAKHSYYEYHRLKKAQ